MCLSGSAFVSAVHAPTDNDLNLQMLKKPPTNVRSSFSKQWAAVIADIDSFLAQNGMSKHNPFYLVNVRRHSWQATVGGRKG